MLPRTRAQVKERDHCNLVQVSHLNRAGRLGRQAPPQLAGPDAADLGTAQGHAERAAGQEPCPPPAPPRPCRHMLRRRPAAQPKSPGFGRRRPRGGGCRLLRCGGCPLSGCLWTASHAAWLTSLLPLAQPPRLPDVANAPPPPPKGRSLIETANKKPTSKRVPPPRLGRPPHSCACASLLGRCTAPGLWGWVTGARLGSRSDAE